MRNAFWEVAIKDLEKRLANGSANLAKIPASKNADNASLNIGGESFAKAPAVKKKTETATTDEAASGPESDFSWLQTLTTLHHDPMTPIGEHASETPSLRSAQSSADDKVFDISEYRSSGGSTRQEATKLELDRRLAAGAPLDTMTLSPPAVGAPMNAPKSALMGSLFPYIAAAFFFAIITAGAIFYFVAIRLPERPPQEGSQTVAGLSAYGNPSQKPEIAQDPAVADTNQMLSGARPEARSRSASIDTPLRTAPPLEIQTPLPLPSPSLAIADKPTLDFDTGPRSSSFASAAMSNIKASRPQDRTGDDDSGGALRLKPGNETKAGTPETKTASLPPQPAQADPDPVDSPERQVAPANSLAAVPQPRTDTSAANKADEPAAPKKAATPVAPVNEKQLSAPSRLAVITPLDPPKPATETAKSAKSISQALEDEYLLRGRETLREGDVAGARLLFQYLIDQGSSAGAYAMGQTYDPSMLSAIGARGIKGNSKSARNWYEKAATMGNTDAIAKVKDAAR